MRTVHVHGANPLPRLHCFTLFVKTFSGREVTIIPMKRISVIIFTACVIGTSYLVSVLALHDSKDLVLTLSEKNALDEFKSQIWDSLKEPFMKSDFYLIRWLRRTNLDVQSAKNLLLQTIQWREKNRIADTMKEDWSDLKIDYPMSFEGQDKEGRPLLFIDLGDWDLRAAVVQGKIRRLQRYLTYSTEKSTQNIFKAQQEGREVTRSFVVVDSDGVNLRQQGCPLCVSFLVQWALEKEVHYPNFTDETVIINAPSIGAIILNAIRAVMTPDLREQTKSFDGNKRVWMEYLDKRIDRDQRTARYGGTKL